MFGILSIVKILRRICGFIDQDPNNIKNLLLKGVPNSNNYNTELLFTKFTRFKDVGSHLNGYNTIREILEITAKQMLVNTMSDTFTGIREQSNLVNQSVNNRLDLIQKHFELLKEQELKNSNKDFLTIKDIKKIENILKEYYPSINISIANEHARTNNKNKKELVKKSYKTKVFKLDRDTKAAVAGATLVIKNENGEELHRFVSNDTATEFELQPGTYTLNEVSAPDGYLLSDEVVTFTVSEDETVVTEVIMYNTKAVKVPITSSSVSILVYLVGLLGIAYGLKTVLTNARL